jgi:DNA-3-methyladenine glycosylase I
MTPGSSLVRRCEWATNDRLIAYHDAEWGVPVHDDVKLFEMLTLEGAQAGLSWDTVLRKREGYREAFAGFDPRKVARFDARKIAKLLDDPSGRIVRNRAKVEATVRNAGAFLAVRKEFGSFDAYVWRFVNGEPIRSRRKSLKDIPSKTPEAEALSKDLLRRGFKFVGSTICYAFMQAVGMVDDHVEGCWVSAKSEVRRAK